MKPESSKAKDVRRRSSEDLRADVVRLTKAVFDHRFKGNTEEKTDRGFVRRTRRDVARIKTILRERERAAEAVTAGKKE